jgi:hypothetical protein
MGQILDARKLNSMWGILMLKPSTELVKKTKMNVILEKKICPLLVDHALQSFLTTNLLLPSIAFEDSTFELEFTRNKISLNLSFQ